MSVSTVIEVVTVSYIVSQDVCLFVDERPVKMLTYGRGVDVVMWCGVCDGCCNLDFKVPEERILLGLPIVSFGAHEVPIALSQDVITYLNVSVVKR